MNEHGGPNLKDLGDLKPAPEGEQDCRVLPADPVVPSESEVQEVVRLTLWQRLFPPKKKVYTYYYVIPEGDIEGFYNLYDDMHSSSTESARYRFWAAVNERIKHLPQCSANVDISNAMSPAIRLTFRSEFRLDDHREYYTYTCYHEDPTKVIIRRRETEEDASE